MPHFEVRRLIEGSVYSGLSVNSAAFIRGKRSRIWVLCVSWGTSNHIYINVYKADMIKAQTWLSIERIRKFVRQTLCFLFFVVVTLHIHICCTFIYINTKFIITTHNLIKTINLKSTLIKLVKRREIFVSLNKLCFYFVYMFERNLNITR